MLPAPRSCFLQAELFTAEQRAQPAYSYACKALERLSESPATETGWPMFVSSLGPKGKELGERLVKANLVSVGMESVQLASRGVKAYVLAKKLLPPLS